MKKGLAVAALIAGAMVIAGSASAAPFASKITVDKKSVSAGETITVSYFLNEAADTVAVELLNGSGTVVATASTTGTG